MRLALWITSVSDCTSGLDKCLPVTLTPDGCLPGSALEANSKSFQNCRLLPRVLQNVSSTSPQTTLFGLPCSLPIYISPASNALLGHPEAELNLVRGAAKTGIVQGVSAASSLPLGELLDEKEKMTQEVQSGKWGGGEAEKKAGMGMVYQVYVQEEREKTEKLVREAVEGGVGWVYSVKVWSPMAVLTIVLRLDRALLLTVDSNILGHRQINEKNKGTRGDASPGIHSSPDTDFAPYHDARLNWDDLNWLKDLAKGKPIYLKGVCSVEDVKLAKEKGLAVSW